MPAKVQQRAGVRGPEDQSALSLENDGVERLRQRYANYPADGLQPSMSLRQRSINRLARLCWATYPLLLAVSRVSSRPQQRPSLGWYMRSTGLFVVALLLFSSPLASQNNITTQRIGDITYYGGTLDGKPVTGTAQQIGNIIYYNLTVDGKTQSWTKQVIGEQTFSFGPNGATSSSQRVGSQTYTQTNQGITYTTQRIGNFIYVHGSNGCTNTIQIIGNQSYTTGNCPK